MFRNFSVCFGSAVLAVSLAFCSMTGVDPHVPHILLKKNMRNIGIPGFVKGWLWVYSGGCLTPPLLTPG